MRAQRERVIAGLKTRNWKEGDLGVVDQIIALDDDRKALKSALDQAYADSSDLCEEIGGLY